MSLISFADEFDDNPQSQSTDDCGPEVDLNKSTPLGKIPIFDQDGSGTCYGMVAAQLIELENRKRRISRYPSAIDLAAKNATGFFSYFDEDSLEGGLVEELLSSVNDVGMTERSCTEKKISEFTEGTGLTTSQFTALLEVLKTYSFAAVTPKDYEYFIQSASGDTKKVIDNFRHCSYQKTIIDLDKIGLLGSSVVSILNELVVDCKPQKLPYELRFSQIQTSEDMAGVEIDKILNSGKPASISFCAKTLYRTDAVDLRKFSGKPDCGNHAALVVGKRKNAKGLCEYLIRNSWGADWEPEGVKCAFIDQNGTYYQDRKERRVFLKQYYSERNQSWDPNYEPEIENFVGCWYPADQIINNTYKVGGMK